MIDSHQDVLAKMICGQGIPNFYAQEIAKNATCPSEWKAFMFKPVYKQYGVCKNFRDDYKYKTDEDGNPLISECQKLPFFKYYSSAESLELFDSLYTNKHGLQDKFIAYWDILAQKFAENSNVMGFDPINEPMASNFVTDSSLLVPKTFDQKKLLPLYERIY